MKTKKLSLEDIKKYLKNIIIFEDMEMLDEAAQAISKGYSVVLDALSYRGNGHWVKANERGRYKYKMIVPIFSNDGVFYSTDLYKGGAENAIRGKYAIYRATRQLVFGIVAKVEADYDIKRFEHGYADGSYGIFKLKN